MRTAANIGIPPAKEKEAALCRIPAFRPVIIKLLKVLNDDHASMLDIAALLNSDPALSAEVLTVANSAAYGTAHRINTTSRAIVMLGTERTKALATKAALDGMLRGIGNDPSVANCWLHSRAVGVIAEWLAPFYRIHPDRAYTAGLMHDIGRLGLLSLDSSRYGHLLEHTGDTTGAVLEAERQLFKVDHCEAGAWLTRTWGLPDELQAVASLHHTPKGTVLDPGVSQVRLACSVAQALGYKAAPLVTCPAAETFLEEIPGLTRSGSQNHLANLIARLEKEVGQSPFIVPPASQPALVN